MSVIHLIPFALLFHLATFGTESAKDACIQTNSGEVCGSSLTVQGKDVLQFRGVPYAQPPVGDLRFKLPQPVKPWNQPIDATQ